MLWLTMFRQVRKIPEIKFEWFQIKIINRILVTSSVLSDMGVVASNLCNFCNTVTFTVYHYLWHYQQTWAIWTEFAEFERCLKEKCFNCGRLYLTPALILFPYDEKMKTDAGFDYILTIAIFLYKSRTNKIRPCVCTRFSEKKIPTCINLIKMITVF